MVKLTISRENLKQSRFDTEELTNTTMTKQDNFDNLPKKLNKDDFYNCVIKLTSELLQEQLNKSCDTEES